MARRGFPSEENKTIYFWSPKCACTTLFRTLAFNFGRGNRHYLRNSLRWAKCRPFIRAGYRTVVITRHPVDRAISAYLNKFVIHRKKAVTLETMESFSRELFLFHRAHFGGDPKTNDLSFEEFVDAIELQHHLRDSGKLQKINPHWDTQAPPGAKRGSYDVVAKVENFPADMKRMCEETGIKYLDASANKTPVATGVAEYLGATPANLLDIGALSHENFVTENIRRRLFKIYQRDFEIFGYADC
ncbi:sulfotransferase family 2 domain-containing protein [Aquibaculum sediminis]|uniref:sulfotransferase family 2 domain-containing protein n=1 Tax=Aquibaculum sediminis TaxID=3231907 RepID=UPI0034525153